MNLLKLVFTVVSLLVAIDADTVMPVADFRANFLNAPHAWQFSEGKGANVWILGSTPEGIDPAAIVADLAPEAVVKTDSEAFTGSKGLVLLVVEPAPNEVEKTRSILRNSLERGDAVFLPAPSEKASDTWRKAVGELQQLGAVVVGVHGRMYQIGDPGQLAESGADILALSTRIDGGSWFAADKRFESIHLAEAVSSAAAVGALMLAVEPAQDPFSLREKLIVRCGKTQFFHVAFGTGEQRREHITAAWDEKTLTGKWGGVAGFNIIERMQWPCLDAALALGLERPVEGTWSREVMRAQKAQQLATGKGVTVAILDHMFDANDPEHTKRTIHPGSVVEGLPLFIEGQGRGHGAWMIDDLLSVAPDVSVMPVRIIGKGTSIADGYIRGIEYAVKHGADIVSISHQPVPKEEQASLDDAIEKAAAAGVTIVYIHYMGERTDLVATGAVEFAEYFSNKRALVIGTGFRSAETFPYTWGMSQTAPLTAGVVAMMKEVAPKLTPSEIREILLSTGREIEDGYRLVDAAAAIKRAQEFTE